jgi:membrane associated rhomboid family serine protease
MFFGQNVEYIYGRIAGDNGVWLFLALYVGAIIISDLPNYFKHKNSPGYNSLGASGGVSAVVFVSILFMPLNDICLYGFICIPGFILGVLYIIYSYYQGRTMSDNINHQAHLVGALFGIIFSLIVQPSAFMSFISQISSYTIF